MSESRYEVIVSWDRSDGIFVAEVPELLGGMAHGETKTDAVRNAESAIELWIETAREDRVPLPKPKGRLPYA